MGKLLIKNIKELVQVQDVAVKKLDGKSMQDLNTIKDAWLAIDEGKILDFGKMEDWPGITDWTDLQVIDASGRMVFPSFCDSHTHLVYAASREEEFVDRIKGLSYQEIAAKGGGILNSAKKLQNMSEEQLYKDALQRLDEIMRTGTGAVEIKSGYGLTVEAELKMLKVIKRLKETSKLIIKSSFLGAHAIPNDYKNNREAYIDLIIHRMLPQIAEENLADFVDVFCETNYFTPAETAKILDAGAKIGLRPKIHVNQFTSIGGIQVGVNRNALSVDHLEVMEQHDLDALLESPTMPTLLPSCSFFLNIPYAPARELIDKGIGIALASDFNPGSTPSGNIPFVLSLACLKLKMTPEEAINASTINAAYAMGVNDICGSIAIGKAANVFITKNIGSFCELPYYFGSNLVDTVILNGEVVE